jgi:uncharacterized protein YuzB (UPF0349 family)
MEYSNYFENFLNACTACCRKRFGLIAKDFQRGKLQQSIYQFIDEWKAVR